MLDSIPFSGIDPYKLVNLALLTLEEDSSASLSDLSDALQILSHFFSDISCNIVNHELLEINYKEKNSSFLISKVSQIPSFYLLPLPISFLLPLPDDYASIKSNKLSNLSQHYSKYSTELSNDQKLYHIIFADDFSINALSLCIDEILPFVKTDSNLFFHIKSLFLPNNSWFQSNEIIHFIQKLNLSSFLSYFGGQTILEIVKILVNFAFNPNEILSKNAASTLIQFFDFDICKKFLEYVQELFDPFSSFSVSRCTHLLLILRNRLKEDIFSDFILQLFDIADLFSDDLETMSLIYELLSTFDLKQYPDEFLNVHIKQSLSILEESFTFFIGESINNENVILYFSNFKFDILSDTPLVLDSNYLIFLRLSNFLFSFPPDFFETSSLHSFCTKYFKIVPDQVSLYFLNFWSSFPTNIQNLFFETYPEQLKFIKNLDLPGYICSIIVQILPNRYPNDSYSQRYQYLQELTTEIFENSISLPDHCLLHFISFGLLFSPSLAFQYLQHLPFSSQKIVFCSLQSLLQDKIKDLDSEYVQKFECLPSENLSIPLQFDHFLNSENCSIETSLCFISPDPLKHVLESYEKEHKILPLENLIIPCTLR